MPLVVNIGVSRKASENYQSAGVSLNLSAELDQSLLANPPELHTQIARLYTLADEAVARQLNEPAQTEPQSTLPARPVPSNGNGNGNGNGHHSGNGGNGGNGHHPNNGQNRNPAPSPRRNNNTPDATVSQIRAIRTIARRLGIDPEQHALQTFGFSLAQASISEASQLIDDLKAMQQEQGQGRR